jgi:hypothetical protein
MTRLCSFLMLLIPSALFAQENLTIKPYWELGDGRTLLVNTEVTIYKNDTLVKQTKGKWEGSIEVIDRGSKDYTIGITQEYLPEFNNYNLFVTNLLESNERLDLVVKMDKKGIPFEVVNLEELKGLYLDNAAKKIREEKKGIKKTELENELAGIEAEMNAGDIFRENMLSHAALLLNMFGPEFPVAGIKKEDGIIVEGNRYGLFPEPVAAKTEKQVMEQKGTKIIVRLAQSYEDPTQLAFFTGTAPDPAETSFGVPAVTDVYVTTYESKSGWPQKKSEESTVVYGPFKHVTRITYKFNKDK